MRYAGFLIGCGAIFAFLGFLFVAYGFWWFGVPPTPPIDCYSPSCEGLWWNQIIGIGVFLIGFGVLLSLIGVAVKGPSVEWSEVAPAPGAGQGEVVVAPGLRYACPGCGGDVYTSQTVCPECGHALQRASA